MFAFKWQRLIKQGLKSTNDEAKKKKITISTFKIANQKEHQRSN